MVVDVRSRETRLRISARMIEPHWLRAATGSSRVISGYSWYSEGQSGITLDDTLLESWGVAPGPERSTMYNTVPYGPAIWSRVGLAGPRNAHKLTFQCLVRSTHNRKT